MRVRLDYGKTGLDVELPGNGKVVGPLSIREAPPLADPQAALEAALGQKVAPATAKAPPRKRPAAKSNKTTKS